MNKEIFDIRNCVIMELTQYDFFMKNYYEMQRDRNAMLDDINEAIRFLDKATKIDSDYVRLSVGDIAYLKKLLIGGSNEK